MNSNSKTISEYLLEEKNFTIKELEILAYGSNSQFKKKRIWTAIHYLVICSTFFGIGYIVGSGRSASAPNPLGGVSFR
jgi:hypothetical protein